MSFNKIFLAALMSAFVMVSDAAIAQDQPVRPTHEAQSVSIPAPNIKFVKTGVKAGAGELEAGPAYGNLQTGRHGTFIRMPAGFVSAIHTHTEDYYAVVVKGVGANDPASATPTPLPVGSYWFQRGEEDHVTRCLSKTDCLFFIVQPGKFDYVPVK
jgi:beta-alanine degradation protein BauB